MKETIFCARMGKNTPRTQDIDKNILVPRCKRPHAETKIYVHSYKEATVVAMCQKVKIKISLLQAVEAPRVARGQGSHIT
jgi:hypothetical protein